MTTPPSSRLPSAAAGGARLVTIFGGSGFVGRHAVRELAKRGWRIRVACRRPDLAGHLQPLGNVGQIQVVQANLRYRDSIDRAVEGADAVVNLVAILAPSGQQTFSALQARGAGWVAEAAARVGASFTHISAIGADPQSKADYASTKAEGERLVRQAHPDTIILRPSIIFGPEDGFFNRFADMARLSPALPLIGGGHTKFQLVYVGDVADAIANCVDGRVEKGTTWELGGPEELTFRQCMERMLDVIDRRRALLPIPFGIASFMAGFAQYAPGAPLTPGQVELLKSDNIVSDQMKASGRTLEGLGVTPTALASVLPTYMVRFRPHGQFEARRGL